MPIKTALVYTSKECTVYTVHCKLQSNLLSAGEVHGADSTWEVIPGRHEPPQCSYEPPKFARQIGPQHQNVPVQYRRFLKTCVLSLNKIIFKNLFVHSGMKGFSKMRSIYQLSLIVPSYD